MGNTSCFKAKSSNENKIDAPKKDTMIREMAKEIESLKKLLAAAQKFDLNAD